VQLQLEPRDVEDMAEYSVRDVVGDRDKGWVAKFQKPGGKVLLLLFALSDQTSS